MCECDYGECANDVACNEMSGNGRCSHSLFMAWKSNFRTLAIQSNAESALLKWQTAPAISATVTTSTEKIAITLMAFKAKNTKRITFFSSGCIFYDVLSNHLIFPN